MIKEHKNKILLTLVLILTLSFSAVAGLLVSKPKASKAPVLSVAGQQSVKEVEQPKVVESNPLTVIRSNTKGSPKLKAQGNSYNEGGLVDWYDENDNKLSDLTLQNIQGGSKFYVIYEVNKYGIEIVADGASKDSGTKYFAIPHNGYRVTGFSFYCEDESGEYQNGKIFNEKENDGYVGTTEDIDSEYEATILIRSAVVEVEYKMNLYYSLDGKEYKPVEQTFKVKTETPLASSLPENVDVNTYGRTFLGNWLVPVSKVKTTTTNSITEFVYGDEESGYKIKFANKDKDGKYKNVEESKTQNDQFYIVNSVTGYCENDETTYEFGEKTDGKMTNPLVRAQWNYVFNARIKTPYKTNTNETPVATAYSKWDSEVDTTTDPGFAFADIKISSNGSYATTFVTNTGNAFASIGDDSVSDASKNYSVINKGYEIESWKVYFSVGNTASTYLDYQSAWVTSSDSCVDLKSISNGNGNGATLNNLSEYLDSYFVGGYDNSISIILEAQWSPVQIKVNLSDRTNIAETKFDGNYSISDNVSATKPDAEGKTVYYYTTNKGKVVAKNSDASKSIKWNYYTIDEYGYDSGIYNLVVKPVYVDNIYRLKLDNTNNYLGYDIDNDGYKDYELIYKDSFGGYNFEQDSSIAVSDYVFNLNNAKNHFTIFDNSIGDITISEFEEYADGSYTFVDLYVADLQTWESNYNDAIAGDSYLLKKVWVANGVGTIDDETKTKLTASSANVGNFYIFLANNQVYGDLPVFNVPSKDIIAWDNSLEVTPAVSYAYKTSAYNDTEHSNALNDYTTLSGEEEWMYSAMKQDANYGTSYNKTLKPVLFRKNYLLDINTLKSDEGMYGYVYVNITDPTRDGKEGEFIVLYNDDGMKIYSATSLQEILDVNGNIGTAKLYGDDDAEKAENGGLYYNPDESNPMLKLYAGCELTIKASSVDYLVAAYADMIGYRLASIATSSSYSGSSVDPLFEGITASEKAVQKTLTDAEISAKNYKSGTVIQINANCDAIKYDLDIRLVVSDGSTAQYAGTIVCGTNVSGTNSGMLVLSGITVDDIKENGPMLIEYLARAGYTLRQDAFTFSNQYGNAITLQGYDISDDTKNSQEYVLEFNGLWLLNNHYKENGDYVVDYTNNEQLNTLKINVETYSFNYEVTVVDANGNVINSEVKDGYSLCLNEESGEENIALITVPGEADKIETICSELVGKEFTLVEAENGIKFYVYKKDGQNYAIISSRLSQIADSRNYNIDYDFLLKEGMLNRNGNPLTQERLDYIFGTGDIVAVADRVLKMEIKVSELYTITMDVKRSVNSDPNDTERTTTLKNHKNIHDKYTNEGSIIAGAGYTFDNKTVVYTYAGVENKLESTFDDKRYKGVTYVLGESSSALTSNFFTLDSTMVTNGNINLYITYEPKPIEVYDINYQLNGITNNSIVGTLINVIETPQSLEAYFGQTAQTKFELLKEEYFAEVSVNGVMVGMYSYGSIATIISEVDARALDAQGFYVIINVQDVPKNVVRFKYALQDTTKAIVDEADGIIDDYGSFDVIISGQVASGVKNTSGWYEYTVLDKKKVELDISDLAIGYHLSKVVLGGSEFATTFNNNKCVISESYTAGQFSNPSFTIYINKDTVKATLTAEGNYKEKYTMSMGDIASAYSSSGNTATRTLNAYIGKTLTFAEVSEETEDLKHYYYIDKNGNECIIVDNSLTLTEVVISSLPKNGNTWNLQIGVKRNFKYKLDVKLKGVIDNDATVSIKYIDGTDYEGEYVYEDTELFVDVLTADYVAGNAKYDIKLSGCINKTVETGIFNKDVDNDAVIVMSGNKTLTIEVSPKVFDFNGYDSWIYENLTQLLVEKTPVKTVENIGNFTIINNLTYKGTVVVRLDTRTSNEELYSIKLTGNDTETIVLTLNETSIVSVLVGTKEYVTAKSNAKHLAEDSEDLVVVANLISKLSEYGYNYSVITDSIDKVQISFVVKNAVKIDAEFVEYKHITQIPNA